MVSARALHLGCGRRILDGWVNLDRRDGPGVDVVADLDACAREPLPFPDDSFDRILAEHLIEHLADPLALMQELHRVAQPGAVAVLKVPYGSSDEAFEDPTHRRPYFLQSWQYFAQPTYWRADYGYRGDWQVERVVLQVDARRYAGRPAPAILDDVMRLRNVVLEMVAELRCVKPARPQRQELRQGPKIDLRLVNPPT